LAAFKDETSDVAWPDCDVTTGADGHVVTLEQRTASVKSRYDAQDLVPRALQLARPELERAVAVIEQKLAARR
jgi:hypothetical protein